MASARSAGRAMGILLFVQGVIGATVNFGLLGSTVMGPPGFLTNAALFPNRMALAALLLITTGFISVAISATVFPIFRRHTLQGALAYLVLTGAGAALAAFEASAIMSMLTISREYAAAGGADTRYYEIVGTAIRYSRYWAHYPNLIVVSGTLFLVYSILFRFSLVPRVLAGLGMATIALQLVGLCLPFFGFPVNFYLLTPMGICHLLLSFWLVVRGFRNDDESSSELDFSIDQQRV